MTDDQLAAEKLVRRVIGSWSFHRRGKHATPGTIRAVLAQPLDRTHGPSVVLHTLVDPTADDDTLVDQWKTAMQAFSDLGVSYAWGSQKRKAKLQGLADDPKVLAAIQAAAVASDDPGRDYLAVLALDASETSQDAFFPHFELAMNSADDKLKWLATVRKHVKSGSGIESLLDRADTALAIRSASSPALGLAKALGFGTPKVFWFHMAFGSGREHRHGVPRYQAHVQVDSRAERWFSVTITKIDDSFALERTTFGAEKDPSDDLGVGWCTIDQLPAWFAKAAEHLSVAWTMDSMYLSSSLRGKKRDALQAWLATPADSA